MASPQRMVGVYQEIAERYDRLGRTQLRDRFLVLAADAALSAGHREEAERTRLSLLQFNPQHLLKPFASFDEAMRSPDVFDYVTDLRRRYPQSAVEQLLESLRAEAVVPVPSASAGRPLPSTIPVIDLDQAPLDATVPASQSPKVFRVQEAAPPGQAKAPRPNRPTEITKGEVSPASGSVILAAPMVTPATSSARPQSPAGLPLRPRARRTYATPDDALAEPGSWVGVVLWVLVLASGLLLAVNTLLRPL